MKEDIMNKVIDMDLIQMKELWLNPMVREELEKINRYKMAIKSFYEDQYHIGVDTNILLDFPIILFLYKNISKLLISRKVYEELDRLKQSNDEVGKKARYALKKLEDAQLSGIKFNLVSSDFAYLKSINLQPDTPDDVIIASYHKEHSINSKKVAFLSNDRGARIIARNTGMEVINFNELLQISTELEEIALLDYDMLKNKFSKTIKKDTGLPTDSNINEEVIDMDIFLQYYKNFRFSNQITYRKTIHEILNLNKEDIKNKIKAELFGKNHIEGYYENWLRIDKQFQTSYQKKNIKLDYSYDENFVSAYEGIINMKYNLEVQGGLSALEEVENNRKFLLDVTTNHGYVALDYQSTDSFFNHLCAFINQDRILISSSIKDKMAQEDDRRHEMIFDYGPKYAGHNPNVVPSQPKLVKKGLFSKPTYEELVLSSYLPYKGNNVTILITNDEKFEKIGRDKGLKVMRVNPDLMSFFAWSVDELRAILTKDLYVEPTLYEELKSKINP
jgi:rRNA-processing protein FCF1